MLEIKDIRFFEELNNNDSEEAEAINGGRSIHIKLDTDYLGNDYINSNP